MAKKRKSGQESYDDPIVQEAVEFLELAQDAESENRRRGLYSLQFAQGGEYQWDDGILQTRLMDKRPCESFNQIPNFINQVANDARMNMAQTKFAPNEDGDVETAEAMEDVARDIQQNSDAEIAYDTAFYGQCTNGWGWWRYITEYENDTSFDQIIKVQPIENPFTVFDDPFTVAPDRLDRKKLIQTMDMKIKDFNTQYDRNYDQLDMTTIGNSTPGWATDDTIRVAEFWKVTEKKSKLWRNKKSGKITETEPKDVDNYEVRDVMKPKVMWYLINGRERLDEREWLGCYIPYVKVVGQEVNIDGKRIVTGLVERQIPAQKQMNYYKNGATEMVALAPKTPFIADPRSIAKYQEYWDQANIRNFAYLPFDSKDKDGNPLPVPQRAQNSADISSMIVMIQQAQQDFYNLSGIYPASLGQQSNEKSGKAIIARQKEGDVSTFHVHDNMSRGQRAGGRILGDLIPKIYDGTRKVKGKKEDGTARIIPINQRFKDEDGKSKEHDFASGKYDIAVTTGPSYTTKRAEAADSQVQMAQAYPPIMEIAGSDIVRNFDWPGAQQIAEKLKILEESKFPQLAEKDEENKIPPALLAQMQQMQQVIQAGAQELQSLQQQLESKEAETMVKMQDVQTKQADLQLKAEQQQLSAIDAERKAQLDAAKLELEAQKLANEAEKNQLEHMKLELEAARMQIEAVKPTQTAQPKQGGEEMGQNVDALRAQLQAAMEAKQVAAQEQQMMLEMQQQEEMQRQIKEQEDRARSDALLQSLLGVQEQIAGLAASVTAPKQVVRDEAGRAIGIQTVVN